MTEDSPVGNKLFGVYRGKVVQHLTHGYCKIYIPSVYPEEWKDKPQFLPPAEQAASLFGGTNNGSGVFTYPNIGSIVWCMFANNDQNYPIYFAACLGGENAFGQHEIIKSLGEEVSERHLITSGKTHIEWYENGKLSVQVEDPDRRDAIVNYNNNYIGQISDDTVSARPICDKISSNELSNIHCKLVMDNTENNGQILLNTHDFIDKQNQINTYGQFNATDNITFSTDCVTTTKHAESSMNINSTDNAGVHEKTTDYTEQCDVIVDRSAKNGSIKVIVQDKSNPSSFSKLYMDKAGNIYIESSASIVLKSKTISIDSENQFDLKAASMKQTAKVDATTLAPAISLDSSAGHTTIRSTSGVKIF